MVPGPSAASSTAERVPTTDVSISDRILRVAKPALSLPWQAGSAIWPALFARNNMSEKTSGHLRSYDTPYMR